MLTELRGVAAAQRARRALPQVRLPTGMSCLAGVGTAERRTSGVEQVAYLLLGAVCRRQPQSIRKVRTAAVTCDDTRTLKFTLIDQRMPMSGRSRMRLPRCGGCGTIEHGAPSDGCEAPSRGASPSAAPGILLFA